MWRYARTSAAPPFLLENGFLLYSWRLKFSQGYTAGERCALGGRNELRGIASPVRQLLLLLPTAASKHQAETERSRRKHGQSRWLWYNRR